MRSRLTVLALIGFLIACDSPEPTPPPTPDPGPPPSGAERITGSERLGWNQQAANGEELATFRYLIYVDSVAADAQSVTCSTTAGPAGFACTARMPSMSAGLHALTLSSFIESGGSRLESPRSPAISVLLVAQTTAGADSAHGNAPVATTRDGVRLFSEVLADDLDEPTDLVVGSDGRMLVAERAGRIRVVRGRRVVPAPAVTMPDVDTSRGGGLLSIAADVRDGRMRNVFALYTTARGFRLARFEMVADTLGNRAILLDEIPSGSRPSGFVRVGSDGRLYVGLDDAGDPRTSGDLGSFNGKILRLNADATTPADQSSGSPVYAADLTAPRGAAFSASGTLWVIDGLSDSAGTVRPVVPAGTNASRYRLPEGSEPSAIAVDRTQRPGALRGNIFVAAAGSRSILRLVPDERDPNRVASTERLFENAFDRVASLTTGPDGAIYLCTARTLVKLTPR